MKHLNIKLFLVVISIKDILELTIEKCKLIDRLVLG